MSHVVTCQVEIKNLEALKRACKRLGWEFLEGQTQHKWYGHWVDDSPTPRNLFATEEDYQRMISLPKNRRKEEMTNLLNKCDHVIRVPGCTYEIGVFQVGDRFELSYDWVGDIANVLGRPEEYAKKWGMENAVNPLPQAYALEQTKIALESQGWNWEEFQDQDGNYVLNASAH